MHRGAGIVAAERLHERDCLLGRIAFLQGQIILRFRVHVVVNLDGVPLDIAHAEFLPFVNKGRSSEGEHEGAHRFRGKDAVRFFAKVGVDRTRLVVVLEENRIPAVACRSDLAVDEGGLDFGDRNLFGFVPNVCSR